MIKQKKKKKKSDKEISVSHVRVSSENKQVMHLILDCFVSFSCQDPVADSKDEEPTVSVDTTIVQVALSKKLRTFYTFY